MRWVECPYCFLVTSEIDRHLRVAHNVRKRTKPTLLPRSLVHLPMGSCFYCGQYEGLTSDHVIPMRLGKHLNRKWNRVPCCYYCNMKKGGAFLSEWFANLEADGGQHFANGPKYKGIMERRDLIIAELMSRPELAKYPGWIGAHLLKEKS